MHVIFVIFIFHCVFKHRSRRQVSDMVDHVTNVSMPTVSWSQEFGETNVNVNIQRLLRNSFDIATGMYAVAFLIIQQFF